MFAKKRPIRLTGYKLRQLNDKIYQRDNGRCIICYTPVPEGTKFHHVKFRSQGGQDIEQNGVLLCMRCHNEVHGGQRSKEHRRYCEIYLDRLYGRQLWEVRK